MANKRYQITSYDKATLAPLNTMLDDIYRQLELIQVQLKTLTGSSGGTSVAHGDITGVTANQHHAQLHSAAHESGGGDALDGTHGIEAIKLVSGNRYYFKNAAGTNIVSIDEDGNVRMKGSPHENQTSV